MPGLPTPIIRHPMGGLRPEEVWAVADQALLLIEHVLVTPSDVLDKEYRGAYPDQRTTFRAKPLFT